MHTVVVAIMQYQGAFPVVVAIMQYQGPKVLRPCYGWANRRQALSSSPPPPLVLMCSHTGNTESPQQHNNTGQMYMQL